VCCIDRLRWQEKAEVNHRKADIAAPMSLVEGIAEADQGCREFAS
jgi:hypothetical protein